MKTIIILTLIALTNICFAQEFKLTAENFKEKTTGNKNFYIIELPGKTQAALFKKAKLYFTSNFKGVKGDGFNEVETEQIVLDMNGSRTKVIVLNLAGANIWRVCNRYEINFKDNKVMIKPSFSNLTNTVEVGSTVEVSQLFNKNGEVKKDKAVAFIEEETNDFITKLVNHMKSESAESW